MPSLDEIKNSVGIPWDDKCYWCGGDDSEHDHFNHCNCNKQEEED
jgi:hypothetical protein